MKEDVESEEVRETMGKSREEKRKGEKKGKKKEG